MEPPFSAVNALPETLLIFPEWLIIYEDWYNMGIGSFLVPLINSTSIIRPVGFAVLSWQAYWQSLIPESIQVSSKYQNYTNIIIDNVWC